MIWTDEHYKRVKHLFPKPRGTVTVDHLAFLRALQYMAENGCRWRALPGSSSDDPEGQVWD